LKQYALDIMSLHGSEMCTFQASLANATALQYFIHCQQPWCTDWQSTDDGRPHCSDVSIWIFSAEAAQVHQKITDTGSKEDTGSHFYQQSTRLL